MEYTPWNQQQTPLKIDRAPKGKDRIPTIHFQVRNVSFREGTYFAQKVYHKMAWTVFFVWPGIRSRIRLTSFSPSSRCFFLKQIASPFYQHTHLHVVWKKHVYSKSWQYVSFQLGKNVEANDFYFSTTLLYLEAISTCGSHPFTPLSWGTLTRSVWFLLGEECLFWSRMGRYLSFFRWWICAQKRLLEQTRKSLSHPTVLQVFVRYLVVASNNDG